MPVTAGLYYFAYEDETTHLPPILLIHGAGGSHLSWPPAIRRLRGYNVYALDLPGHGKSEGSGEQTISAYADHVLAWMETTHRYRAFLVGHSMGGAIALRIAAVQPARVAGLGLLGIGTPLEVPQDIIENLSNPAMISAALNRIRTLSFRPEAPSRLVDLAFRHLTEMRASVLRGDFIACARFDIQRLLMTIEHPAIVIAGALDQMTPLRYSQLLAKKIKGAKLCVIPDAGHLLMLEKPDETVAYLRDFLQPHGVFV